MNQNDACAVSMFLQNAHGFSDAALNKYAVGIRPDGTPLMLCSEAMSSIAAGAREELVRRGPVPQWKFVRLTGFMPSYPEQAAVIDRAEAEGVVGRGLHEMTADASRRYDFTLYRKGGTYYVREDYGMCRTVGTLSQIQNG